MQIQRIPLVVLTLATGLIAVDSASAQRRYLNVKDPAEFRIGDPVFSGPQPGEQLRGFSVTPPTRTGRDEDFDPVALAAGKPHFLMFVDDSDLQEDITAWLAVRKIHQNSRTGLAATAVILGHERATKLEFTTIDDNFFNFLNGIFQIGYAPEGRDGPGAYGLDRNIKMTILIDPTSPSRTLDVLGRCGRENSCEDSSPAVGGLSQKLHMFNGPLLNARLGPEGSRLRHLLDAGTEPAQIIEEFYLVALGRHPSAPELDRWIGRMEKADDTQAFFEDWVWGLLTSRDFVTNH